VPMLQEVNRGAGHSFGNLERDIRQLAGASDRAVITLSVRPRYSGTNTVPASFQAVFHAEGSIPRQEFYSNVR